jgi:hypothetical protein
MLTHDLELNGVLIHPEVARGTRRVSPIKNEVTSQIIAPAPASAAPQIAPDIPVAIHPGPVLGVARDDLTGLDEAARLPAEARDEASTAPAIATPDQIRALHRTPRHVVLVFSGHRALLFDGAGDRLAPAANSTFPMDLPALDGSGEQGGSLRSALGAVDLALGKYLRLRQAPIVLAGPQKIVSAFWSVSQNMARLAGTVYGSFDGTPTAELARRTRPVLDRYLDSHEYAALALLQQRASDLQMASGITSVWHAARTRQPEMLVVEDSYRYHAPLSADGDTVTQADDATAPESNGNLVDELIKTVLTRGGSIVLAHDGALPEHGRVALTLR